jgi:hypothetical protein
MKRKPDPYTDPFPTHRWLFVMGEIINIILAADMEDRLNEFCKKCICHMFQKFNDCIIWKNLSTGDGSFRGR